MKEAYPNFISPSYPSCYSSLFPVAVGHKTASTSCSRKRCHPFNIFLRKPPLPATTPSEGFVFRGGWEEGGEGEIRRRRKRFNCSSYAHFLLQLVRGVHLFRHPVFIASPPPKYLPLLVLISYLRVSLIMLLRPRRLSLSVWP